MAIQTDIDAGAHDALLQRMRLGARRLRAESVSQRVTRLKRLRGALSTYRTSILEGFAQDLGKSPESVDLADILPVALEIEHAIKNLRSWTRTRTVGGPILFAGTRSQVRIEPKGVALIVAAWNYPLSLTLGPLVSAIAAGCAAVIKPSEFAPGVAKAVRLIVEACYSDDEVCVVEGGEAVSRSLTATRFDHIYFTGSTRVGRFVMRSAAENLTSLTLELGGKSPTIVDESADINRAAERIVFGKFSNVGQTCVAPDYVFVHERRASELSSALTRHLEKLFGDAPTSPDYGRLNAERHRERLETLCDEAVADGATIASGESGKGDARYLPPTILSGVSLDSRVMQEEIFGPVLPVISFTDLGEVLEEINRRPAPLALYIFASKSPIIKQVIDSTQSGGVVVNDTILQFANPSLPFGGIGESGLGRGHGHAGFLEFSNLRPVMTQNRFFALTKLLYPPYGSFNRRFLKLILRIYRIR